MHTPAEREWKAQDVLGSQPQTDSQALFRPDRTDVHRHRRDPTGPNSPQLSKSIFSHARRRCLASSRLRLYPWRLLSPAIQFARLWRHTIFSSVFRAYRYFVRGFLVASTHSNYL